MTNKYKYRSVSFREDDMRKIESLSDAIKKRFGKSLSNNKVLKLGILSLEEELSDRSMLVKETGHDNSDDK